MALDVGWLTSSIQDEDTSRLVTQLAMMPGSTPLKARAGLLPVPGAADLSTVSEMTCAIAPFGAVIPGTSTGDQGGYPIVERVAENQTFDNGEAGVIRNDRVIAHIKDDVYDAGGVFSGTVEVLKGNTVTGAATAIPATAIPLFKIAVPVGASVGTGGINFTTAVTDEREYTVAFGGILPIDTAAKRDAIANPYRGFTVYNKASRALDVRDASAWQHLGIPIFPSKSAFTSDSATRTGDVAFITADNRLYYYNGSAPVPYNPMQKWTKTKLASSLSYATNNAWVGFSSGDWPALTLSGVEIGDQIEIVQHVGLVAVSGTGNIGGSFTVTGVGITEADYDHELLHNPDTNGYGFTFSYTNHLIYDATSAGTATISPRTRTAALTNGTMARGRLAARVIR